MITVRTESARGEDRYPEADSFRILDGYLYVYRSGKAVATYSEWTSVHKKDNE